MAGRASESESTERAATEESSLAALVRERTRELEAARRRLEEDHAALERLHELSARLMSQDALPTLLEAVIEAAIDLTGAHMGTLQLYDERKQCLRLVAHRGFRQPFLDHFALVHDTPAVCGEALRRRERVIVEDVLASPIFVGTPSMAVMNEAGVRAAQSTVISARDGRVLGTMSTHFTEPHCPGPGTLRLLDLLAREAGLLIEDRQREQALRRSEALLADAARISHFASWEWEVRTGGLTWSDEAFRMLGLEPGSVDPGFELFRDLVHPDDRAEWRRAIEDTLAGTRPYGIDFRVVRPDGVVRWMHAVGEVTRDAAGQPVRMTGVSLDITEQRRAEEGLREANALLREEDRCKNEFLAMLSHELRNPLAPIHNSLYVLEHATAGGEQARRAQAIIARQVCHMTRLVEDLLDVTRVKRGKVQLQRERVDLVDLVRRTVEDHRSVFARSDVQLEVRAAGAPVWVDGDRTRLAQVVGNLLQNAAKFTPRGGTTTVTVGTHENSDNGGGAPGDALLTVHDTGSGIAPEMMGRMFEAFAQADQTLARSQGGLGLGLALVKGLVEMHGGSIHAESDGAGQGATFIMRLPLAAPRREATGAERTPRDGRAPRRVLVIEDNVDAADSLRETLELAAHVVEVAHGGPDGLEKARTFEPDVVLCDIGLPGMDGYEVARAMRAEPRLDHASLVALTGYAQAGDVARARAAGFDAHLSKPASIDALLRVLDEERRP